METHKHTQLIRECPLCHGHYSSTDTRLIRESEQGSMLYYKCSQCTGGLIATVVEAPFGLLGSGMVTDLQYDEVEKFFFGEHVTEDDVISIHAILSHNHKLM